MVIKTFQVTGICVW